MEVDGSDAKNLDQTKLNDTTAHEPADTVTGSNSLKEFVRPGGTPKGPFGQINKPGD